MALSTVLRHRGGNELCILALAKAPLPMRRTLPLLIAASALAAWLALGAGGAQASRFGPPWQARLVVDTALIYSQPDLGSAVRGPLRRGAIVVVTGEQLDGSDH